VDKKSYWQYLKDSLGVDNFIIPPREFSGKGCYNCDAPLGFFMSGEATDDESKLFLKMIAAIGLSTNDIGLFMNWPVSDMAPPCRVRVVFEDNEASHMMGTWQNILGLQIFTTYSLSLLLEKPELKKKSWEHLKTIISVHVYRQDHPIS